MNTKSELRKTLIARREEVVCENDKAGQRLADAFLSDGPEIHDTHIVAGYWPIRTEIDARPLMERLHTIGVRLALPAAPDRHGQIVFRCYERGTPPTRDAWGIPSPEADAQILRPSVVLVPLLGFDKAGGRIGYGAGIYDRAITRLRSSGPVIAVGIAFACQEVDEIPSAPHDALLDWVVTESGVRVRP